jgi:hypothetical protein
MDRENFFSSCPDPFLGSSSLPSSGCLVFFPRGKAAGAWSWSVWPHLVKHRDTFTFIFILHRNFCIEFTMLKTYQFCRYSQHMAIASVQRKSTLWYTLLFFECLNVWMNLTVTAVFAVRTSYQWTVPKRIAGEGPGDIPSFCHLLSNSALVFMGPRTLPRPSTPWNLKSCNIHHGVLT